MMKWSALIWLVLVMAVVALQVRAAPAPRGGEDNMFRELLRLDQMYSSIARPRFGKRTESHSKLSPSAEYDDQYPSEDFSDWLPARR